MYPLVLRLDGVPVTVVGGGTVGTRRLTALLDAAGQAAAIGASNAIGAESGISFNQFQSGSKNLAQGSYGDDIDIPPTLRRAQAPQVLIMAMDDIDMRPCFSLTMAR